MNPIPDLIPLPDGRPGVRASISVDVRSPSALRENSCNSCEPSSSSPSVPDSCLDFISSDATLDRYSEIISPAGWHLDNYRRNPVFQNAHKYGDIIFTLGRALITEVREISGREALFQRIQFAVDANPMASGCPSTRLRLPATSLREMGAPVERSKDLLITWSQGS